MTTNRLRVARAERDVKQVELARRVGVHATHLSQVENGWRVASPELKARLAEALDWPLDELFPTQPEAAEEAPCPR